MYLPIHPSPPHPDTGAILHLREKVELAKRSYINTQTRYLVPNSLVKLTYCHPPSGKKYRLDRTSWDQVRGAVDDTVPIKDITDLAGNRTPTLGNPLTDTYLSLVPQSPPTYNPTSRPPLRSTHVPSASTPEMPTVEAQPTPVRFAVDNTRTHTYPAKHTVIRQTRNQHRTPQTLLPLHKNASASKSQWTAWKLACAFVSLVMLFIILFIYRPF